MSGPRRREEANLGHNETEPYTVRYDNGAHLCNIAVFAWCSWFGVEVLALLCSSADLQGFSGLSHDGTHAYTVPCSNSANFGNVALSAMSVYQDLKILTWLILPQT